MRKVILLLASGLIPISMLCQEPPVDAAQSKAMAAPALPYYDWKPISTGSTSWLGFLA